ncbi:MAG: lipoate--protein ligase [Oscillospiraceae bacterium]|nr:lipoate--protein ligase [Oscillospiraceae bacterium]
MVSVVISESRDPYYNVALEKYLFSGAFSEDIIYFWQNAPCVVIGRNQNVFLECNLDYMKEKGILPVRRFSGGGAVYQDSGNLNFTYITNKENDGFIAERIKNALSAFGIESVTSARNDLLYNGKKFSGTAYLTEGERRMYHGTLMINVDIENLYNVLTPSELKIKSHGIDSVKSRVINLSTVSTEISAEKFISVFVDALSEKRVLKIENEPEVEKIRNMISSEKWIFGEAPKFEAMLEYKIGGNLLQVNAEVKNGIVEKAKVFSDALEETDTEKLAKKIIGRAFDEKEIRTVLEKE